MAKKFLPVDRDRPALLPENMYDWVPKSHLVWFVIDIVERLDMSAFLGSEGTSRAGRRGYDPVMLLTLLVYAYASGLRSSRQIEDRCRVDATFRLVCANLVPDHTTICRFRRRHGQRDGAIESVFTQVLAVCAAMGLGRIDVVSADGTKIKASAAKEASRTEEGLRKLARRVLDEADRADRGEPETLPDVDLGLTGELDQALSDPGSRAARIAECLASLAAERQAKQAERDAAARAYLEAYQAGRPPSGPAPAEVKIDAAELALARALDAEHARDAEYERQLAAARAQGRQGLPGPKPKPAAERASVVKQRRRLERLRRAEQATTDDDPSDGGDKPGGGGDKPGGGVGADPAPVRNITDPHARVMRTKNQGSIPAYNAQVISAADRLALECYATNDCVDVGQATRLLDAADTSSQIVIAAHTAPGHDAIACHAAMCPNTDTSEPCDPAGCHQRMTHELGTVTFDAGYFSEANITADGPDRLIATGATSTLDQQGPATGDPPPQATAIEKMSHRLRTPAGKAIYKRRAPDVEGVNASFKDNGGLRQFLLRGLQLADFEVKLTGTAHNLRLAHRHRARTQPATA